MSTGRWINVDQDVPKNGEQVMADWTDNTTGISYLSYATWNKDTGGWTINSSNTDDFTVNKWRKYD